MKKKKLSLKKLIFMTLCLDMGIVLKKLLGPGVNVFTDLLRIPGGIGTSFSLMFILVGAVLCDVPFGATLMCFIQSLVALCLGSVGSMGLLAPLGFILPGVIMDLSIFLFKKTALSNTEQTMYINGIASASAALVANLLVFRLWGVSFLLYTAVSLTFGLITGLLASFLIKRLRKVCKF